MTIDDARIIRIIRVVKWLHIAAAATLCGMAMVRDYPSLAVIACIFAYWAGCLDWCSRPVEQDAA